MKKKTVKEVKMHKFLVCACKSQDFAQSQKNCARSRNRVTVTFRNSKEKRFLTTTILRPLLLCYYYKVVSDLKKCHNAIEIFSFQIHLPLNPNNNFQNLPPPEVEGLEQIQNPFSESQIHREQLRNILKLRYLYV